MANNEAWEKIFNDLKIYQHDFNQSPFYLTAEDIKKVCQDFKKTGEKEPRILCKQDSREDRPQIFIENNVFILPIKNGYYAILQGDGYIDIPEIKTDVEFYD